MINPPINFIVTSHSKGKRRNKWGPIDKAYMHNTWRSSQASYHLFPMNGNLSPSDHVFLLLNDLLSLSLHIYETVGVCFQDFLNEGSSYFLDFVDVCIPL
ncbi:proteasome activator subunit 4-like [Papaver somniferum]|uniref:proteasome activator subunit 4-like n=1 Tax=Papaver somniferum TaxID=3469 RepID=UPI000E6F6D17|nr:proteasome activator subunit 4-like [Papaver somniferum]